MKSRRYKRKSSQGSQKAKKIIIRILFVLLAACIITALTILLGHHLLDKAREAEQAEQADTGTAAPKTVQPAEFDITCTKAPSVKAVLIDPDSVKRETVELSQNTGVPADEPAETEDTGTGDPVHDLINSMSTYYETMVLDIRGNDGRLAYSSPSVMKLLGVDPGTQEDEVLTDLKDTVAYIKAVIAGRGLYETTKLRICGIIPSYIDTELSGSADIADLAVISELADLGFDEVIVDINGIDEITYERAVEIRIYLNSLIEKLDGRIYVGVLLPDSIYIKSANARVLQVFASSCDFICMDFDSDEFETQKEAFTGTSLKLQSLQGIIGLYNIRAVVNDRMTSYEQAEFTACEFAGLENIMVLHSVLPEDLRYDEDAPEETRDTEETDPYETEPAETDETTIDDNTNPYATIDTDVEPIETDENGEPVETDLPWF